MKSLASLTLVSMLLLCFTAKAQFNIGYSINDSIEVKVGTEILANPWAGGFNSPQFSQIDLNKDNKLDLLVFDRNGNTIKTFINEGATGVIDYRFAPKYQRQFPDVREFVQLRDFNCDGLPDVFTYKSAGFEVHQNITDPSDSSLFWQKITPVHILEESGSQVYNLPQDLAAIDDMDGDGDLDILAFSNTFPNNAAYYQNLSVDSGWGCDSLRYKLVMFCWGGFGELATNFDIITGMLCKTGSLNGGQVEPGGNFGHAEASRAHAGSTLLTIDIDADNDKDLVLGDVSYDYLKLLTNGGDQFTATITQVDSGFPLNTQGVQLNVFPGAYYMDIDNDGKDDFLSSPNTSEPNQSIDNSWFYKNNGATNLPDLQFVQKDFLTDGMIDVGAGCHPALVDVDADGLLDLVVGNLSSVNPAMPDESHLNYFRNTGTPSQPAFEWVDTDFQALGQYGLRAIYPTFGDLDGDGDQDLLIGDSEGELHYFENTAGVGNPMALTLSQTSYMSIDVGQHAAPQLIDLNRDSLLDLVVGEKDGILNYFENQGTSSAASFPNQPSIDSLGGVIAPLSSNNDGYSSPSFTDQIDTNGNFLLMMGGYNGVVKVYDNVENNLNGTFTVLDSIVTYGSQVSVTSGHLNGDSILEIITGEIAGGLQIWTQEVPVIIGLPSLALPWESVSAYPNPTHDRLRLEYTSRFPHLLTGGLMDVTGRQVKSFQVKVGTGKQQLPELDLSDLASGLYFVRLSTENFQEVVRIVKQ